MSARTCLVIASILGFLAVFLGAFGAHGLKDTGFLEKKYASEEPKNYAGQLLPASYKYLLDFETAVRYHMWHALAMGLAAVQMQRRNSRMLAIAACCFGFGIVLFSGSLYVLVIGGPRFGGIPWGAIAPFGGTLLLIGWAALAIGVCRQPSESLSA